MLAILTQLADTDELGEIGDESAAAFDRYVAAGRNRRHFLLWRSSADPALLAAVVPAAVELLNAASPTEFDEGLAPFVRRAFETRFPSPHELHRSFGVGGATLQAWTRILGGRQSLTTRLRSRYGGTETRPGRLALLPQMLWPDVFEQRFARFLPDVDTERGRHFCSLALGVLATKTSHGDVATGLGAPRNDLLVKRMNRLLRDRNQDDAFYQALVETARWLDDRPWTVDYGQRRRALADLVTITDLDWQWACSTSAVHTDYATAGSHSSTWIWCALTGGVPDFAPTSAQRTDRGELATYRRFVHADLPALQPALVVLAIRELQHRGLGGPVRADLSGWDRLSPSETSTSAPWLVGALVGELPVPEGEVPVRGVSDMDGRSQLI